MFIREFYTEIRHTCVNKNRLHCLEFTTKTCPTIIDFAKLATSHEFDEQFANLLNGTNDNNNLLLKRVTLFDTEKHIVYEFFE